MRQAEWDEWVKRHATIFGFNDANLKMLDSWREAFAIPDYTPEEMNAATDAIAAESSSRFPQEHRAAIHAVVRNQRASKASYRADDGKPDLGTCTKCGSTGRVTVPALEDIQDGVWIPRCRTRQVASYYEYTVLCTCPLGSWFGQRLGRTKDGKDRRMMTLADYETKNSAWRSQVSRRMQEVKAEAELRAAQSPPDKAWMELMDRLLERYHALENQEMAERSGW